MKTRLTPTGTLLAELPSTHPRFQSYLEAREPGLAARRRNNGNLLIEVTPEHPRFLPLLYAHHDQQAGTNLLEGLRKGEVERKLKEVGKVLRNSKDPGPMPGYGQIFINDSDLDDHEAEVWYVGGDGDDRGFDKVVEAKIKEAFPGCKYIHYEAEGFPPRGEEWIRVYPSHKEWRAFADEDDTDIQEGKDTHTYSNTQLNLPPEIAWGIRGLSQCIEDKHLTTEGREDTPHLTAKYGLHTLDSEVVRRLVQGFGPIPIILGPVSLFLASESGKADVVKIEVVSPRLHVLNQLLSQLEHTDTYPAYQPHITLAYVKPGQGARYLWGEHALQGQQLTLTTLTFSDPTGNTTDIDLCGPKLGGVVESVDPQIDAMVRSSWKRMDRLFPGLGFDKFEANIPDLSLEDPSPFVTVKPVTIAVDLDGTLAEYDCSVKGHATVQPIGVPRQGAVELMEMLKAAGHTLLIWTCRGDESEVRTWLVENGIPFDAINENPCQPDGTSCKLMANVYLDDRALYAGGPIAQVAARLAGRLQELDAKYKEEHSSEEVTVVVIEAYNPEEQRDNHGRWSAGAGNEDINEHHGLLAEQYHKAPTAEFNFGDLDKVMERVDELNNEQLVRLARAAGFSVIPKSRKGILDKLRLNITNRYQTHLHARQIDKLFETMESLSRGLEVKIKSLPKFTGNVKYEDAVANPLPHKSMSQKQQDSIVNLAVLDLTPADWQRSLQSVSLDQLHSFQPWVTRGRLLELAHHESGGTSIPRKLYRQHPIALVAPGEPPTLLDGNHRAVINLLGGNRDIECYLLTPDSKPGTLADTEECLEALENPTAQPPHPLFTGIDSHGHKWINGKQVKREDLDRHVASHYTIDVSNIPTTPADHQEAASKAGSLWGKMKPATQQAWAGMVAVGKKTYHTLETPFRKGREMALAAAKARGASEEDVARLGKVLGMADLVTAWTVNFPVVTAATGNPVLGKASSWLPLASACYLAYSTSRAPVKTLKAAAQVLRGNKSIQESELMEAKQVEGVPFQGPSGKWFVLRQGHVVPTKAPGSGNPGVNYVPAQKDPEVNQGVLDEVDRFIKSLPPFQFDIGSNSAEKDEEALRAIGEHPALKSAAKHLSSRELANNPLGANLSEVVTMIRGGHPESYKRIGGDTKEEAERRKNNQRLARYLTYRLAVGDVGSEDTNLHKLSIMAIAELFRKGFEERGIDRLMDDVRNPLSSVVHRLSFLKDRDKKVDLSAEYPDIPDAHEAYPSISTYHGVDTPVWIAPPRPGHLRPLTRTERIEYGYTAPEDIVTQLKDKAEEGDKPAADCLAMIKDINNIPQVVKAQALYDLHFESQYYPVIGKKIEELRKGKGRKGLTLQNMQALEGWLLTKRAEVPEVPVENPKALYKQVYGPDKVNQVTITINVPKATSEVPKAAGDYVRFVSKKTGQPVFMGQIQPRSDGGKSGWGPESVDQDDTHYHYKVKILDGKNAGAKIRNGRRGELTREEEEDFKKPYDIAMESVEETELDNTFTLLEASVPLPNPEPGYTGVKVEHVQGPHGAYTRRVYYVNGKVVNGPHEMPRGWVSPSESPSVGVPSEPPSVGVPSGGEVVATPQSKTEPSPAPEEQNLPATKPGLQHNSLAKILYPDQGDTPESTNNRGEYTTETHKNLAEQPVQDMKFLTGGLNGARLATFADGSKGVWKNQNDERHDARESIRGKLWRREVAASQIADILGLGDLVPPTVVRTHGEHRGSMQQFVKDAANASKFTERNDRGYVQLSDKVYDGPEDLARAAAFDFLTMNTDRHDNNWMVRFGPEKSHLVLIDNGYSFPDTHKDVDSPIATHSQLLERAIMDHLPVPKEVAQWEQHAENINDTLDHNGVTGEERALTIKRLKMLSQAARTGKTLAQLWYDSGIKTLNTLPTRKMYEQHQRNNPPRPVSPPASSDSPTARPLPN